MTAAALPEPDPLGLLTVQRVAAAVVAVRGVACRSSAALLWGIELVRAPVEPEVAVGRDRSRTGRPGARVHRTVLPCADVLLVRGVRATSAVRTVLDLASGSVLESLCRVVLEDGGLRPFETQHVVRTSRGTVGRVDVAWPEQRLVVEVDGFAFHADRARYRADRRRTNALVLAGWRVLRFRWEDVVSRPEVVVAQVRAALDV